MTVFLVSLAAACAGWGYWRYRLLRFRSEATQDYLEKSLRGALYERRRESGT